DRLPAITDPGCRRSPCSVYLPARRGELAENPQTLLSVSFGRRRYNRRPALNPTFHLGFKHTYTSVDWRISRVLSKFRTRCVMSTLIAIVYPTEAKAEEVRNRLFSLQREYLIKLADAVIATKTD